MDSLKQWLADTLSLEGNLGLAVVGLVGVPTLVLLFCCCRGCLRWALGGRRSKVYIAPDYGSSKHQGQLADDEDWIKEKFEKNTWQAERPLALRGRQRLQLTTQQLARLGDSSVIIDSRVAARPLPLVPDVDGARPFTPGQMLGRRTLSPIREGGGGAPAETLQLEDQAAPEGSTSASGEGAAEPQAEGDGSGSPAAEPRPPRCAKVRRCCRPAPLLRTGLGGLLLLDIAAEGTVLLWRYEMDYAALCEAELAWSGCAEALALAGSGSGSAVGGGAAVSGAAVGFEDVLVDLVMLAVLRLLAMAPVLSCRIRWAPGALGVCLLSLVYAAIKAAAMYAGEWQPAVIVLFALSGGGSVTAAAALLSIRARIRAAADGNPEAEAEIDGRPVHWTQASGRAAASAGAGMGLGARLKQRYNDWQWKRTLLKASETMESRSRGADLG